MILAACATPAGPPVTPPPTPPGTLLISPQNDGYSVGRNRVSLVIQDAQQRPVLNARAGVEVRPEPLSAVATKPLVYVGADYPQIPIYTGLIELPRTGSWLLVVHARLESGGTDAGQAFIRVDTDTQQLLVGQPMPPLVQPLAGPGTPVRDVDSGVPPDAWHDTSVAAALAIHRPFLLYVGEPGRCLTRTCGDMIAVLVRACVSLCGQMVFEHLEVHSPADSAAFNPAWLPFHFQKEQPWVYLINSQGVIADRFEGPAPLDQILDAAHGTLAGHVPAA